MVCVSGCCLHVFAHANAAVAAVNLLVPTSTRGIPITKAIRAQLKKPIRRNKNRAAIAKKFEELIKSYNPGSASARSRRFSPAFWPSCVRYLRGVVLTKFTASSVLPLPLYFATCGYGNSGRVRITFPLGSRFSAMSLSGAGPSSTQRRMASLNPVGGAPAPWKP